jgi:hypothetical protein
MGSSGGSGAPQDPDEEPMLGHPIMQAAVLVWTLGIFAIAIVLAYSGRVAIGLLVLAAGLVIGLFAFWRPLVELYHYLRGRG